MHETLLVREGLAREVHMGGRAAGQLFFRFIFSVVETAAELVVTEGEKRRGNFPIKIGV